MVRSEVIFFGLGPNVGHLIMGAPVSNNHKDFNIKKLRTWSNKVFGLVQNRVTNQISLILSISSSSSICSTTKDEDELEYNLKIYKTWILPSIS